MSLPMIWARIQAYHFLLVAQILAPVLFSRRGMATGTDTVPDAARVRQ